MVTSGFAVWKPATQACWAFSCALEPPPFSEPDRVEAGASEAPSEAAGASIALSDPQADSVRARVPTRATAPMRPRRGSFTVVRPVDLERTDVCAARLTVGSRRDRPDRIG